MTFEIFSLRGPIIIFLFDGFLRRLLRGRFLLASDTPQYFSSVSHYRYSRRHASVFGCTPLDIFDTFFIAEFLHRFRLLQLSFEYCDTVSFERLLRGCFLTFLQRRNFKSQSFYFLYLFRVFSSLFQFLHFLSQLLLVVSAGVCLRSLLKRYCSRRQVSSNVMIGRFLFIESASRGTNVAQQI